MNARHYPAEFSTYVTLYLSRRWIMVAILALVLSHLAIAWVAVFAALDYLDYDTLLRVAQFCGRPR